MKTKSYAIICFAVSLCSCSFKEDPTSFVNRDSFYQSEEQANSALTACYMPMNNVYTANFLLAVEACTDIWYSTSSTTDSSLDVTPAKAQVGVTVWNNCYTGVMRCNECIECINNTPYLTDEQKLPLQSEARVLRAWYYYILTSFFNGVPFYTYMVKDDATLEQIRRLPRTDANEIRQALYNDLKDNALPYFTVENGLKKRPSELKDHKAGYAMCCMLMAKMAMWYEDWEGALVPLKNLEGIFGELTEERYPLKETMWRFKNTNESIFEIQHEYKTDGMRYYSNAARMLMPKWSKDYIYDGIEVPVLGNDGTAWNAIRANNIFGIFRPATGTSMTENTSYKGNTMFDPLPLTYDTYSSSLNRYQTKLDYAAIQNGEIRGKKIDRRVYYVLGLGNLDSLAVYGVLPGRSETESTFNITRNSGIGWGGPKFWCLDMIKSYDGNNYKVFRYADAVLMMAECYIALKNSEQALKYINYTRARAGVDPITVFNGFEDLTAHLRCERARELGGEFQRKFDLVRWGVWYEQTYSNTNNSSLKNHMKPCHRYYPIPDTECALSGRILTNDEYVAYGM